MTKAQEVYERVNALVESGATKAEAFRQLSDETGTPVKSLQGAYYSHGRKGSGGPSRARKRETTTTDAVTQAVTVLEKAIDQIDAETQATQERAREATAEYEALQTTATDRKQAIQAKIDALRSQR